MSKRRRAAMMALPQKMKQKRFYHEKDFGCIHGPDDVHDDAERLFI
jgi:hypothetical protein